MDWGSYKRDKTTVTSEIPRLVTYLCSFWPLTLRCSHTFQSSVHHWFQVRPQDSLPRTSQPQLQRTSCWRSAAANAQAAPRSDQGWRDTTTTRLSCGFDFNFSMCFLMFLCAVVITSLHYSCLQNHGRVSMTYRVTCCTKVQSIWIVQANCALKKNVEEHEACLFSSNSMHLIPSQGQLEMHCAVGSGSGLFFPETHRWCSFEPVCHGVNHQLVQRLTLSLCRFNKGKTKASSETKQLFHQQKQQPDLWETHACTSFEEYHVWI